MVCSGISVRVDRKMRLLCRDVREKMVAYNGKFIKVQEVRGSGNANGTGFAITLGPCPLLDKTNLGAFTSHVSALA